MPHRAFAIAAHPDDIEFMMSGTLILLGRAGYELHYMTIANGSCGSERLDAETIVRIRREESRAAAALVGAVYHESLVDDLEILYDLGTLRRVASVLRTVAPEIVLTHWPDEYMEDHSNTSRLVCTAAFARGMRNFRTDPAQSTTGQAVTIYHALPYGLHEPLGQLVHPEMYVDVTDVMEIKRAMLATHRSQKEWLDASQGIDAYLDEIRRMCRSVGHMSGRYAYAEGWTRRLHLGYCSPGADPLRAAIGPLCTPGKQPPAPE
ncbi:MAG: PIG-L family deacetylase [Anaerolineae bacterium]|nr:PIG-L family deacetylase [Anaerolineae bacterium]